MSRLSWIPTPSLGSVLDRLEDEGHIDDREAVDNALTQRTDSGPWLIHALAGFGAWVAAIFFVAALFASEVTENNTTQASIGLILASASVIIRRRIVDIGWFQRILVSFGIAGQFLVGFSLFEELERLPAVGWLGLLMVLTALVDPGRLQGFVSVFVLSIMGLHYFHDFGELSLGATAILSAVASFALLWILHSSWGDRQNDSVRGRLSAGGAGAAMAFFFCLVFFPSTAGGADIGESTSAAVALIGVVALRLLVQSLVEPEGAEILGRREPYLTLGVLIAVVFLCPTAPGIPASLLLLGYGWWRQKRSLVAAGGGFLLFFVGEFYFSLSVGLMEKAAYLAAAALTLWVLRFFLRRDSTETFGLRRAVLESRRAALFWSGLLIAVIVPTGWVMSKEAQLRSSTPILLELAPVDPRSLMQGDYMILEYRLENDLREASRDWLKRGQIVIRPDERGVAAFVRPHEDQTPLGPGELLLRYRRGPDRLDIGQAAFFFEEGRGKDFARAQYARIRLDASGAGILTDLLDEELRELEP